TAYQTRFSRLKEYQQKNSPGATAGTKKKRKTKEGSRPETPTNDDRQPPENVSVSFFLPNHLPPSCSLVFRTTRLEPGKGCASVIDEWRRCLYHQHMKCATIVSNYLSWKTRYQELAVALDSSNLTNKQLVTKIEELVRNNPTNHKDILCLADFPFPKVHIQTIGILVSEKSELQTALGHTQQAARQKSGEAENLAARLHSSRQRVSELERTLSSISMQQKQSEKVRHNKELVKERDNLKLELYKRSKSSEEIKQQNSELSEKVHSLVSKNSAMKLDMEDLHKKLEMAELMIQQFSNQAGSLDANQQLQMALEEKASLETQVAQVRESLHQLQAERDQYVEKLKEERSIWQQRVQQLSEQVHTMAEEKEKHMAQIRELEANVAELLIKPMDIEPSSPAEPTAAELSLHEEIQRLQQEKEELHGQYQAQVRDNEQLSHLNREQEERLLELEKAVQRYNEESVDRQQILEDMQSDKATISRALSQNRELKEQLAELQNGFVKLTNENMEVTSALQSEQHVKKELAKKLGQLQENLGELKESLELKTQEARGLQEQRDQYYSHLQQYTVAYQQLAADKEELHKQYLLQTQLMDRLQHEEVQGKVTVEMHLKELQQTKVTVKRAVTLSQHAPLMVLHTAAALTCTLWNSSQVAFLTSAMSQVEKEREDMRQQLAAQKQQCRSLLQQIAALRQEQQHNIMLGGGKNLVQFGDSVNTEACPRQLLWPLKGFSRFTDLMREKADLKDRLEELEHRCIQLSGETDTIGEYIALYQSQRAILKQRHQEKEEYISRLAQDKEEMKMKLLELQDLVMRLVRERNEWYSKYVAAAQNPELLASQNESVVPAERRIELNATDGEGKLQPGPAPKAAQPSQEDPTAKQIMQLLREIQNPQERLGSLLENPCIPFFYRADENDEVKIMVV
uniref:Golgin subfamily A conserved domain-containing protein n=1 Tax=Strix occidentalis caurina TaxID=311401 RepID=A0A8D0G4N1_STROC